MLKAVPRRVRIALLALFTLSVCSEWSFSAQSSTERAQEMLSKGSPEQGVALLRQIVKTDPGNVQAHLILGTALAVEGLRNESVEQITAAIKLLPNSADAYNR